MVYYLGLECGEKEKKVVQAKIDRERRSDSREIERARDYVESLLYTLYLKYQSITFCAL